MITELIIVFLLDTASWLLGLFPVDSIDWPEGDWIGDFIGPYIGPLNGILPLTEAAIVTALVVTTVLPITLSIRIAMWLWFLLPVIK